MCIPLRGFLLLQGVLSHENLSAQNKQLVEKDLQNALHLGPRVAGKEILLVDFCKECKSSCYLGNR